MLPVSHRRGSALLYWAATFSQLSDDQLRSLVAELERRFRDEALTSAAEAATIILDGVKADRWRILVGADAHKIDEMVRQSPERAYDIEFFDEFARAAGWTERLSREPRIAPAGVITGLPPVRGEGTRPGEDICPLQLAPIRMQRPPARSMGPLWPAAAIRVPKRGPRPIAKAPPEPTDSRPSVLSEQIRTTKRETEGPQWVG